MKKWEKFWQKYRLIDIKNDEDLLYQVGKTTNGNVINKQQFNVILKDINNLLVLDNNDRLLDLCCGNGILTYELAKKVRSVIAFDFSEPYIKNAEKYKQSDNITYKLYDIKKIDCLKFNHKFSKILIYDALAYFNYDEINKLLQFLKKITTPDAKILFSSVLDYDKKWNFFNTTKRKFFYYLDSKILNRNNGLGKWWGKKEIEDLCQKNNLKIDFRDQSNLLHTSHYRVDILTSKKYEL